MIKNKKELIQKVFELSKQKDFKINISFFKENKPEEISFQRFRTDIVSHRHLTIGDLNAIWLELSKEKSTEKQVNKEDTVKEDIKKDESKKALK